ncbi:hypothetical protein [Scytonema sp. UIC 10036]|nr:hypothetical protein [Scytonema sp. UIC 10036]
MYTYQTLWLWELGTGMGLLWVDSRRIGFRKVAIAIRGTVSRQNA